MRELLKIVEEPRRCSYLPKERAALEFRLVSELSPGEYSHLLNRGYRRFGRQIFRPACPRCSQCISLRVPVDDFCPSRSQKRAWKANQNIDVEICPPYVAPELIDLYNLYHADMKHRRGWPAQKISPASYVESFVEGSGAFGRQWLYFQGSRLVGVALMDEVPDAVSMVYFYYHPQWRDYSPGIFSILNQISYAQRRGLQWAYLGYWIDANPSMRYKSAFRPHQILHPHPAAGEDAEWRTPKGQ